MTPPTPEQISAIGFRVWPDGTIQEARELPYSWMSDYYEYVEALDAWHLAK